MTELSFDMSEVTQTVKFENDNAGGQILYAGPSEGYRESLKKGYMEGVREYLNAARKEKRTADRRFLFLSPNKQIAAQAYLVLRRGLSELCEQEDDEYAEFYGQTGGTGGEETFKVNVFEWDPDKCPEGKAVFRTSQELLVELSENKNEQSTVDWILSLDNAWIAVSIRPKGSYEYIAKRLTFEGGYRVITLWEPGFDDYLEYASKYLEYHHFKAEENAVRGMLKELCEYRGTLMRETDIYVHLDRCMQRAVEKKRRTLSCERLRVQYDGKHSPAREEFERTVGLEQAKQTLYRRLAAKKLMQEKHVTLRGNYIMEGPPGTGKSRMARILARLMGEMGIGNGKFVDASRADLIGKYIGHTAVQVKKIFERAKGGVLFIDEAAFLTQDDDFVHDAVIELVRFMELDAETTVIFATYPKEAEKLLACDPGFASRIHQVIRFEAYTDEELCRIFDVMTREYGFEAEAECAAVLKRYLTRIRDRDDFGNAREVRKLLENAIEEAGLRTGGENTGMLLAKDLENAGEYLLADGEKTVKFGFAVKEG